MRERERLEKEDLSESWPKWKRAFLKRFHLNVERKELVTKLSTRFFDEKESPDDYVNDVIELCEKLNMTEESKVDFLVKGLAKRKDLDLSISAVEIDAVDQFTRHLKRLCARERSEHYYESKTQAEKRGNAPREQVQQPGNMGEVSNSRYAQPDQRRNFNERVVSQRQQSADPRPQKQVRFFDNGRPAFDAASWVCSDGSRICSKCHRRGHVSSVCQQSKPWQPWCASPPKELLDYLEIEVRREQQKN